MGSICKTELDIGLVVMETSSAERQGWALQWGRISLKFWGIIRTPKPPLGLKSACTAPLQIYNMVLRAFLQLKVFCSFLCCVSQGKKRKERKKIHILCSGLLLSLIYYRTGAKERKTGHEQRTHLAMSYRFPLPASSNYSKKKKKNVFHRRCSWGVNCQNVFAEKLLLQKTWFCQGSNFWHVSPAHYFSPFKS